MSESKVECSTYLTTYAFGPGHKFKDCNGNEFIAISMMHHWYRPDSGLFYALVDAARHMEVPPVWVAQEDLINPDNGWVITEPETQGVLEA